MCTSFVPSVGCHAQSCRSHLETERFSMRTSRKWLTCSTLALILAVIAAGLYGQQRWQRLKQENGITAIDWQGLGIGRSGMTLQRFIYKQETADGGRLELSAEGLRLRIGSLFATPALKALHMDRLEIEVRAGAADVESTRPAFDPTMLQQWAAWIPEQGSLPVIELKLPCASGQCQERLSLRWQHAGRELLPAEIDLTAQRDGHRLQLDARAWQARPAELQLNARLSLDGQPRIFLNNLISSAEERWSGSMTMGALPEAPWLLDWLSPWLPQPPQAFPALAEQMHLVVAWSLERPFDSEGLPDGEFNLDLNLPEYWPLPVLGQLKGDLNLQAQGRDGVWLPSSLDAALDWRPEATLLEGVPAALRPAELTLGITPGAPATSRDSLPLRLHLQSEGKLNLQLDSALQLHTRAANYRLESSEGQLRLQAPSLDLFDHRLTGLEATLGFTASADLHQAELRLEQNPTIRIDSLRTSDWAGEKLQLSLKDAHLQADLQQQATEDRRFALNAAPELRVQKLSHALLKPLGWQWSGKLQVNERQLELQGPLRNDAGLTLQLALAQAWGGTLAMDAGLQEIFFRAGNPLSASFSDWPQTLAFDNGRLNARASLEWPAASGLTASLRLEARGLSGIYARSELSGLDTLLEMRVNGQKLQVDGARLDLQQLNVGFPIGPLHWQGSYQANLRSPASGRLQWQAAETRLLGGRLWLDAGEVDLAASEQRLALNLEGLQIPELLRAYPAEGLTGSGIIDGNAQLRSSPEGYSIDQGLLNARAPGGVLQFRSAKIQALGQSNPAMKIVAEALDDFHYSRLDSDVRYDERGKLQLGLRLHGNNPTLEGGRPINFSINLEEDIPALLTSLQLSDRVSETIQRRVQQSLQRDKTAP
ncbi:dicarboxylate transport [Stutzerimonas kirkiae]|nr:dicarboxylate transport [Stutzerimonas kirkiae]